VCLCVYNATTLKRHFLVMAVLVHIYNYAMMLSSVCISKRGIGRFVPTGSCNGSYERKYTVLRLFTLPELKAYYIASKQ
jgi:hypothetical protein